MESFSKQTKLELVSQNSKLTEPFFFGLFVSSGYYDENGNAIIVTDLSQLFPCCKKALNILLKKQYINENIDQIIYNLEYFKINNKKFYKIIFSKNILEQLFEKYGLNIESNIEENLHKISQKNDDIKNFCKGMFLGCGTSSIRISQKPNEKTSNGYHLEFSSKSLPLLREFAHMLAQFEILPKLIKRKNIYVLYLKDANQVSNLLALIGANNSVLTLENEIVKRDFRNKINRQTNCLSANISKTVEASLKQLEAIEKIDKKIGLSALPPDLEEIALLRLANPEEPLSSLLLLSNIKLTKSGLNHRLRKIISIAENL